MRNYKLGTKFEYISKSKEFKFIIEYRYNCQGLKMFYLTEIEPQYNELGWYAEKEDAKKGAEYDIKAFLRREQTSIKEDVKWYIYQAIHQTQEENRDYRLVKSGDGYKKDKEKHNVYDYYNYYQATRADQPSRKHFYQSTKMEVETTYYYSNGEQETFTTSEWISTWKFEGMKGKRVF